MREWLYRRLWRFRRVRTQEQALRSIRDHHRALGVRVDDISDEELIEGIRQLGIAIRNAGVPLAEASAAMAASFRALDSSAR